jgi:hypothetical protein
MTGPITDISKPTAAAVRKESDDPRHIESLMDAERPPVMGPPTESLEDTLADPFIDTCSIARTAPRTESVSPSMTEVPADIPAVIERPTTERELPSRVKDLIEMPLPVSKDPRAVIEDSLTTIPRAIVSEPNRTYPRTVNAFPRANESNAVNPWPSRCEPATLMSEPSEMLSTMEAVHPIFIDPAHEISELSAVIHGAFRDTRAPMKHSPHSEDDPETVNEPLTPIELPNLAI